MFYFMSVHNKVILDSRLVAVRYIACCKVGFPLSSAVGCPLFLCSNPLTKHSNLFFVIHVINAFSLRALAASPSSWEWRRHSNTTPCCQNCVFFIRTSSPAASSPLQLFHSNGQRARGVNYIIRGVVRKLTWQIHAWRPAWLDKMRDGIPDLI